MKQPLPLCACGCGRRLKRRWRLNGVPAKYFTSTCIPHEARVASGRKGRLKYVVERRLALFRTELRRLHALDKITGQELTATFAAIYARAWDNGYSACETKWLRRPRRKKAA